MAYKESGEWVFEKKEVDKIFEKAINKRLKKTSSMSESEIFEIGRELEVDSVALRNAILDVKSSSDIGDIIGRRDERRDDQGVGGTQGGFKSFFIGIIMAVSGGYLVTNQVQVRSSGFWGQRYHFGGASVSAFGITLIPLLLGIGMLFFNAKSKIGWVLTGGSALAIFVGIITNLSIYFRPTSLYITLIMLVLLIGGLGLIFRSLRSFQ
ncbi:hypothetical protein ACFL27_03370 [candidate division CSSED10-310 bacterium]|uniref:DUF1700 domain-containing protein n=1 Tax=candidate division CSSED10-310 bacterium TaxID=2855610 RepID=A0ABV6YSQ8_UNCC1